MQPKIKSFTDLSAWREAHQLAVVVYQTTKTFPREEIYSLVDQMRRCAVSISSNIAEGFSRKTKKEKLQFFYTSLGSLTELQNQLLISRDIGYLNQSKFSEIVPKTIHTSKLINGLIKYLKT